MHSIYMYIHGMYPCLAAYIYMHGIYMYMQIAFCIYMYMPCIYIAYRYTLYPMLSYAFLCISYVFLCFFQAKDSAYTSMIMVYCTT